MGLALALVYTLVAVVYVRVGGNPRPLFDGFAPTPPYNWVNPPPEFRAGNVVPRPATLDVPLTPEGSAVASGATGDGQVVLSFGAGAFPPHPPDVRVVVHIAPVDPAALAPPPPGLAADGNAYRVDFEYEPSRQAAPLTMPSDVFLVVPEPAQTLLYSPDGRVWENIPFRTVPDPTQIGGAFPGAGYLLAVAPPVGRPSDTADEESEALRLFRAVLATVALAGLLVGAPVALRAARRRREAGTGAGPRRRAGGGGA